MRHALCDKNGDLLQCSRVNPYVRMRMRFSNSCVSDKLDRSMSRFMRHPIEKTEGEFQGMTSPSGHFPDRVWGFGLGQRLSRWANINPALGQSLVFAGMAQ